MFHDVILLPAERNTMYMHRYMFAHIHTFIHHSNLDHLSVYYITYVRIIVAFSDPNTVQSKTVPQKSMLVHSVFSNNFTSDYQTSQNTHSFGIAALWLFPGGGTVIMWFAFLRIQH